MIMRMYRWMSAAKPRQFAEEGSALIELAFALPLLTSMLLGAAEFARLAYASIEVTNAAHAAALYASSSVAASSDTGGITNAANSDSSDLSGGNAISVSSVTTSCSCADTTYTPTSCSDNSTCTSNNTSMVTTVTVKTQSTFYPLIHKSGDALSYTLKGTSTQVVSNE